MRMTMCQAGEDERGRIIIIQEMYTSVCGWGWCQRMDGQTIVWLGMSSSCDNVSGDLEKIAQLPRAEGGCGFNPK